MRKLKIDRHDFELAFELSDYDARAYLDSVTGEVMWIESDSEFRLESLLSGEETV